MTKKTRYNDASYYDNKSNHYGKISPVNNDEIKIIGTRPALNKYYSPICREIVFTQAGQLYVKSNVFHEFNLFLTILLLLIGFLYVYRESIKYL